MPEPAKAKILHSKVNQTLRDLRRLDKSTVKGILGELKRTRIEISETLKGVERFEMGYLRAIRDDIELKIRDFESRMGKAVTDAQDISFSTGAELSDDILKTTAVSYGFPLISEEIIATAKVFSVGIIADLTDEMVTDINKTIRNSMLRGESNFQAARKIDNIIGVKKNIGYMNRADLIARQELDTAFSIARQAKDEMIVDRIPAMKKQWWTAQNEHVRPSPLYPQQMKPGWRWDHRKAHGQIREVKEPFDVSGEKLMYPRDRNGSLGNIMRCVCQSIPYMEGWE